MGAFIGSLYAKYPNNDYKDLYTSMMESYVSHITKMKMDAAESNGLLGGIALAFINPFLGLAGGILIAENSANLIDEKNLDTFELFLNDFYNNESIQNLPVKYATSHFKKNGQSVNLVINTHGNLANAIAGSISNPYIFNLNNNIRIDPGIDRNAATPISDACSTFRPDIIIAINVTGKKAIFDSNQPCKVMEIELNYSLTDEKEVILGRGNEYETLIKKAFSDTLYQVKEKSKDI